MNSRTHATKGGILLLILALLFIPGAALASPSGTPEMSVADAAPPRDARAQFYDFGNQLIEGDRKAPPIERVDGRPSPRFGRLVNLKKSFLSAIVESHQDRALR